MSSEYAVWFAAHKEELELGAISKDAFSVFEEFLNSEITANDATAQLITGRTPADEDKIRRHVFSLIVAVAQFFPEAHQQLVELSKEIFSDPNVDQQPFGWGLRATHDGLEAQIRETLKKGSPVTKGPISSDTPFSLLQSRWANFHAFNAKCCAEGTVNVGEHFVIPAAGQSLDAKAPGPMELQVYSAAVTAWLTYAAPQILVLSRNNASSSWREAGPQEKLWKGKEGFSEGRWEFWKTRLEELRESKQGGLVDEETAGSMRQAFVAMEKAERAKKGKK